MMHSSTMPGSMPARRTASATTSAPSCGAVKPLSAPRNLPVGVRTALTMTASRMSLSCSRRIRQIALSTTSGAEQRLQAPRMTGDERITSRAHCALAASTSSTRAFELDRASTRSTAGPTAALQAKSTLPSDSGAPRSSSTQRARHAVVTSGSHGRTIRSYHCTVRLILASASPRRAELLRAAGFTFDVVVADVDESIRPRRIAVDRTCGGWRRRSRRRRSQRVGVRLGRPRPDATVRLKADATSRERRRHPRRRHDGRRRRRDPRQAARRRGRRRGCCGACRADAIEVLTGVSLRQGAYRGRAASKRRSVDVPRADRRRHRLVRRQRGRARQGRRLRHSGPGVAIHPAHRRIVFKCRRPAGRGRRSSCCDRSLHPGASHGYSERQYISRKSL